jgi:hypothetical protein
MALINCKECNHEISELAATCPHCGAPNTQLMPITTYNPKQDQFLTRNRGCLEILFWLFFGIFLLAMLKNLF